MKPQPTDMAGTRALLKNIAFDDLLGIEVARLHADGVTLRCKVRKDLLNKAGALHGGVTATLADAAVGIAIHRHVAGKRPISTVEMKINYFRPVLEGGIVYARARLLRIGATLCVGQVDLTDNARQQVGTALVTYIFLDRRG